MPRVATGQGSGPLPGHKGIGAAHAGPLEQLPASAIPAAPSRLTPRAAEVWADTWQTVGAYLTPAAADLIEQYASTVDLLEQAEAEVLRDGLTVETPAGPRTHPSAQWLKGMRPSVTAMQTHLGLTPAGLERLRRLGSTVEKPDDLAEYRARKLEALADDWADRAVSRLS